MKTVVIIGAGPAGMFCADELSDHDIKPVIIDSGKRMEDRKCPESAECNCRHCDILEGEGGAGGFSDGKKTLTIGRGTQGEDLFSEEYIPLIARVDEKIVRHGGKGIYYDGQVPYEIDPNVHGFRFSTYPLRHIGSDGVRRMIIGHRDELKKKGVEFLMNISAKKIMRHVEDGSVSGIIAEDTRGRRALIRADYVVAATGLQGSPWITSEVMNLGGSFVPGPAGIAVRLETRADVMQPLFDSFYDFKIERGNLRSFCCNSHGSIVNENHITLGIRNVNGHSYLDPSLRTNSSNFAIMAKIGLDISSNPQADVCDMARSINSMAGGHTAIQRAIDFVDGRATLPGELAYNKVRTNFQSRSGVDIARAMTSVAGLREEFEDYVTHLDGLIPGVLREDSLIYAPEVKYFSPKISVEKGWRCSGVDGLYVPGNASGYIDSFVAAAMSGIVAAKDIIERND
jgi:uncharacterized protein